MIREECDEIGSEAEDFGASSVYPFLYANRLFRVDFGKSCNSNLKVLKKTLPNHSYFGCPGFCQKLILPVCLCVAASHHKTKNHPGLGIGFEKADFNFEKQRRQDGSVQGRGESAERLLRVLQ